MKITTALLATIIIGASNMLYAQIGWNEQSSATYPSLLDVFFIDSNTGWAVGGNSISGTIVNTTDGGVTWNAQTSGTTMTLFGVSFADASNGWAVGESGTIVNTTDGGISWGSQTSGTAEWLSGVSFVDVNTGWAIGDNGTILNTNDGGTTWTVQSSGTTNNLLDVFFINSNTGWIAGGKILSTTNGGATWTAQDSCTLSSLTIRSVHFIDASNGWAAGSGGSIVQTVDGGVAWNKLLTCTAKQFQSVFFTDASNGWAVGGQLGLEGIIYRTNNGGANWSEQTIGSTNATLFDVFFTDANTGWIVGTNGFSQDFILNSTDGGVGTGNLPTCCDGIQNQNETGVDCGDLCDPCLVGWTDQDSQLGGFIYGVHFSDDMHGFVAAQSGVILHTADGGANWENQYTGTGNKLRAVSTVGNYKAWVVGDNGTILYTDDAGCNWYPQTSNIGAATLHSVFFINDTIGWAAGYSIPNADDIVLKTSDGGTIWSLQNTNSINQLNDIYFVNESTGWIVGRNGHIISTIDGGSNWNVQNSGISGINTGLYGVHFTDANNGWVCGFHILRTTDGGSTWSTIDSVDTYRYGNIHFTDNSKGWVVDSEGIIRYSSNGGTTWTKQDSSDFQLLDIYFTSSTIGWAVGYGGTIMHTIDGGMGSNLSGTIAWIDSEQGMCNGTATVTASDGTPPYTYLWDNLSSQTTTTASGLCENTVYTVVITDADNNTTTISVTIGTTITGIKQPSSRDHQTLSIYPNPNNGNFELIVEQEELINAELTVYNALGEEVYYKTFNTESIPIDLSQQSKGIYLLQVRSKRGILMRKIIIE